VILYISEICRHGAYFLSHSTTSIFIYIATREHKTANFFYGGAP